MRLEVVSVRSIEPGGAKVVILRRPALGRGPRDRRIVLRRRRASRSRRQRRMEIAGGFTFIGLLLTGSAAAAYALLEWITG
jgi:hypothetical protein